MAALTKTKEIDLLPQDDFEGTTAGRFVLWLLSTFRVAVITTMLIVISAFVARFGIDAKNSDLSDEIAQKQATIAATEDFEEEFKKTQEQIRIFKETISGKGVSGDLEAFISLVPAEIVLKSLSFTERTITATADAPGEQAVEQLMVNLAASQVYENISLGSLESDPSQANVIQFSISATKKS